MNTRCMYMIKGWPMYVKTRWIIFVVKDVSNNVHSDVHNGARVVYMQLELSKYGIGNDKLQ